MEWAGCRGTSNKRSSFFAGLLFMVTSALAQNIQAGEEIGKRTPIALSNVEQMRTNRYLLGGGGGKNETRILCGPVDTPSISL